ncbi:MAG: transporter [Halobacteriaceae archaeon]
MSADDTGAGFAATAVVRGGAAGAVAYLGGYISVYPAAGDVRRLARAFEPLAAAGGRGAPAWKVTGWAFYDAHFVGTRFAGRAVDLVSFAGLDPLYLVPPLSLALAGGVAAYTAGARRRRTGELAGMAVAAGYLPLVVGLAVLVRSAGVGPALLRAVVVAGVVYPVAFGGTGGVLAAGLRLAR